MRKGGQYWVASEKRKFWWTLGDEIGKKTLTEEEKRILVVEKGSVVEVKPDCRVDFTAVA
jgi:hypothetical protein